MPKQNQVQLKVGTQMLSFYNHPKNGDLQVISNHKAKSFGQNATGILGRANTLQSVWMQLGNRTHRGKLMAVFHTTGQAWKGDILQNVLFFLQTLFKLGACFSSSSWRPELIRICTC